MTYPYLSQWNNQRDPSSSCVLTCLAMGLSEGLTKPLITPDDLWLAAKQRRWDRLAPETVDRLSILYQRPYRFRKNLTFVDLTPGSILYGGWTPGGHCVLLLNSIDNDLIYHDPLGRFDNAKSEKYDFNSSGERVRVISKAAIKFIGNDGEIWGHLPI